MEEASAETIVETLAEFSGLDLFTRKEMARAVRRAIEAWIRRRRHLNPMSWPVMIGFEIGRCQMPRTLASNALAGSQSVVACRPVPEPGRAKGWTDLALAETPRAASLMTTEIPVDLLNFVQPDPGPNSMTSGRPPADRPVFVFGMLW